MKTKVKIIFPAALAALTCGAFSTSALADTASTNAASGSVGTNAGPEAAMTALFGDPVIVRGKGLEIRQSQLDSAASNFKEIYAARGLAAPPSVDGQALQALIFQQLILSKATEADRARGKEQFNASLQKLKTNQHLTDEQFNQTLEKQLVLRGQTRSQWEKQNIDQATIPVVLERELSISVTDAEAKDYYTNPVHAAEFEQPEMVRLGDILLLTVNPGTGTPLPADQQQAKRKKMDELLKRARSGENFTNLAAQYSEDPSSKDNNGELPRPVARGQLSPELAAAAFSLTNNQISDIIELPGGYCIIKLLDKIPAKKLDYVTVADDLKEVLKQRKIAPLLQPYLAKLKKAAGVEILDPKLEAMEAAVEAAMSNAPAVTPGK